MALDHLEYEFGRALTALVRAAVRAELAGDVDSVGPLMKIERAAQQLDCSPDMVYRLAGEGVLERVVIGERGVRVTAASVERYVADQLHASKPLQRAS
jgi:excisionase family DNA binding protein